VIPVKIVDPEKVAWQGDASQVVFAIGDGLVGIRTGHADAAFAIQPCLAKITAAEGTEVKLFLSAGVARVQNGALTVVADSAETPQQIDRRRAEEALQRAKDRLAKGSSDINFDRARLALARAIHRLQLVDHPL
jgi:F-type H+-transporting ATPase subunit epsilon